MSTIRDGDRLEQALGVLRLLATIAALCLLATLNPVSMAVGGAWLALQRIRCWQ